MIKKIIRQYPSITTNWLYKDTGQMRLFSKDILYPEGVEPWSECSNEEKIEWERQHLPPEEITDSEALNIITGGQGNE